MIELKNLRIDSPFKNLNGLKINFQNSNGVTVLIGNNGSGKSNILEAISSIFAGLYDNENFNPAFKYEVSYTKNDALINIKYDPTKSRNKYEKTISDDDPLPTQIISIYSGEEQRMWNRYYFTFYENFNKDVISGKRKFNEKQKMEFLNKYHWNISLVTMIASYLDISDIIQDKQISYISFHFKKHNIDNFNNYDKRNSNEVTRFAKLIYESSDLIDSIKDTEIRAFNFNDFSNLIIDTHIELFRKLTVSILPKEDKWKLIDKMEVFFESDENEDSFSTEELSEGQKKQLLIKFATKILADENSILLLDEPDSHIHISNKEKIKDLLYEDKDKPFVQSIITTHSPTLTSTFSNENVFMLKKENKQVQIVNKEQQEIIKELFGEKFSPQVQNMFLASNKPIILLVEGKHDKLHIINAHNKLKIEYPTLDFDVFSLGGEGKIHPFMNGLYEANIQNDNIYIGIYDNDNAGTTTLNKAGFDPDSNNNGYRKLKKDKTEHNHFFAFPLIKPNGFNKDCTIENMFASEKYEEAFKGALEKYLGNFSNKSIDDINKDIKEASKNILAENSKNFELEDFKHFRKLFDLILEISNLNKIPVTPIVAVPVTPQVEVNEPEEPITETVEQEIFPIDIKAFNNHKKYTSKKTWSNFLKMREELLKLNPEIVFESNKYFVSLYFIKQNFAVIRFRKNSINVLVKFSEATVKEFLPNRNFHQTKNGTSIDNISEDEDFTDVIDMLSKVSKIKKITI